MLTQAAQVTLRIYNVVGQEVATLFNNQEMDLGRQTVQFDASSLASGVYFYRLEAVATDERGVSTVFTNVKKMMLVK